jgi:starch synthase (maltosyl-transferring)
MRLRREKLVVITNGIDVSRFASAEPIARGRLGLPPERRFLLYAGRLDPQKQPDWLLEQMPAVFGRLPNHDLVIAGDGPMRETLRKIVAERGIAERVHFVGWQMDMPRLLASADVVVLTSRWEGMPNILLEAMASAKPIVTTDVHGARELLGENSQGQITPAGNATAFVEALVRIASDAALACQVGKENRRRAATNFSIDHMIMSYVSLYESLLAK